MKTIIVGGVAAGASTAARLRRLKEFDDIILLEKGEYIAYANCGLPYHLGGVIPQKKQLLLQTPQAFHGRFCVDVRTFSEAVSVDFPRKLLKILDHRSGRCYEERYDNLVLAPDASPVRPAFLDGTEALPVFSLNDIPDADRIKSHLAEKSAKSAIVIGGGFIGIEAAENLKHLGLNVRIFEMAPQLLPAADWDMASMIQSAMEQNDVSVRTGERVLSLSSHGSSVHVETDRGGYAADIVLCAVGVAPNTRWLRESDLEMDERGAIVVDAHMRTNMEGVYAAGDAVLVRNLVDGAASYIPLAGPANRQGRIVADNIAGLGASYRGAQGSMILKVFDRTFAMTGLKEDRAAAAQKIYISAKSHAGYYPGARDMWIKLLFEPQTGRVLGAQAFGEDGVDKRIDVFATAIRANMTVFDMTELELCYAPPYGAAKDPVNMAAFAAQNALNGLVDVVHGDAIAKLNPETQAVLDVRTGKEYDCGHIAGSIHIPLHELRARADELPRGKQLIVHCASGMRSYIACRMLAQRGFACANLSGGYDLYDILYGRKTAR
ncbi:MAG: FAD-dependent oxidoreductase [Clostridiales bacterium]|nr:FAD-dependent oxidoreductase [Clostridiales bacterium]